MPVAYRTTIRSILLILTGFLYAQNMWQATRTLHWLEGHWLHVATPDTVRSGESWQIGPSGHLYGRGYEMHQGDTVFVERLQIAADGTSVRYIVNVEHHPAPVKFVLVNSDHNKWVFENPLHDFPNTIAYIREGPAHMTCVIKGNGRSRAFHFEKVE